MNYASVKPMDISNGEGIRVALFVSGCYHHCIGCFNKEAQNFNYGQLYTQETEAKIIKYLSRPYIDGLSILGGDPMCQDIDGIYKLIKLCKRTKTINKNVWLWTGFTLEDLMIPANNSLQTAQTELLKSCDIIVDGKFVESKKDLTLAFRGSANQRIIDVKESLDKNEIVLYTKYSE